MLKMKKEIKRTKEEIRLENLKKELKECDILLKRSRENFRFVTDEHLIEARIYNMKSLSKHREYILSQIKIAVGNRRRENELQEIL